MVTKLLAKPFGSEEPEINTKYLLLMAISILLLGFSKTCFQGFKFFTSQALFLPPLIRLRQNKMADRRGAVFVFKERQHRTP